MNRILVFIDWYEPGFQAGGPIRSVKNLVDALKGDLDFFIFTRDRDYQSDKAYSGIPANEWIQVEPHVQVYYCSPDHLNQSTIRHILGGEYDSIYINGLFSPLFSLLPLMLLSREQKRKTVVAPRGMLAAGALGVKGLKKRLFLQAAKTFRLFKGIQFHATNSLEAESVLREIGKRVAVYVAENLGSSTGLQAVPEREKSRDYLKMVSIARISPEKNTLYALQLLQQYNGEEPLEFDIYGPVNNADYWEQCQQVISTLASHIQVAYKGSIANEQVAETLQQYHLFLLPSRGENFGHSILEALKSAVPVLISDKTPWRELERGKAGLDLPLEQPAYFLKAVQRFAQMGSEEYRNWMAGALALAKRKAHQREARAVYRRMFKIESAKPKTP